MSYRPFPVSRVHILPAFLLILGIVAFRLLRQTKDQQIVRIAPLEVTALEVSSETNCPGQSIYRSYLAGELRVYETPHGNTPFEVRSFYDSATHCHFDSVVLGAPSRGHRYFVYQQDSLYGISYDPFEAEGNRVRLRVDSTLKSIISNHPWTSLLKEQTDSSIWNMASSVRNVL